MTYSRRAMLRMAAAVPLLPGAVTARDQVALNTIWLAWPDEQIVPQFNLVAKENPDIKVDLETYPFSELFQIIDVRLQPRQPTPDIFLADTPLTAYYAARGHLQPIEPMIGSELVQRYSKAAVDAGSVDGDLMSLPLYTASIVLYINKEMFEAAGVELPSDKVEDRWTWEETLEVAKKLSKPDEGIWGLVFEQTDRVFQLLPLSQSNGGQVISDDGLTTSGYIDGAASVEAIEWYQSLYTDHQVSPPGVFDLNLARELFFTGKAAMFLGLDGVSKLLAARPEIDWMATAHPYFEGGMPVTPTGSWHIGANPRSEHPEAQAAFLRTFASPRMSQMLAEGRGSPPVMDVVWEAMADQLSDPMWDIMRHELGNTAVPRPATPGFREYEDILRLAFREIIGGADVRTQLSKAAEGIDARMAKYR